VGNPGQSRHDLVASEVITLTAVSPVGVGVTYLWEILDKAGSSAVLSGTTGASVTVGPDVDVVQPCAFLVRCTANDSGTITVTERIASVRTAVGSLRLPLFHETAPGTAKLSSHTADLSTDNAIYVDRAGLGAPEQNWRGWAEWAYEVTLAVAAGGGGGGAPQYTVRLVAATTTAVFGEVLLCSAPFPSPDPSAAYVVDLPALGAADAGKVVIIKLGDNSPAVTITSDPADTIEGALSYLLSVTLGAVQLVAFDSGGPGPYGWVIVGGY
jgi:hypothetical protein